MTLHERIAEKLGWSVAETKSMSLQTLRELVRPVSAKLAHEITYSIRTGAVVVHSPRRRRPNIW